MTQARLSEAAKRRLRAGRLLLSGKTCAEVACAVGVARQTVYMWRRLLDEGGIDALREVPERGSPAHLDAQQLAAVRAAVLRSPTEHGFGSELWTLKRVGAVIERMHGVRFGQTQVWRILGGLGFSSQKPEKCAIERDENAVRSWNGSTQPKLKKSPAKISADSLCRRVEYQRTSHASGNLGASGANAHYLISFQLESRFDHRGAEPHELSVPAAPGSIKKKKRSSICSFS